MSTLRWRALVLALGGVALGCASAPPPPAQATSALDLPPAQATPEPDAVPPPPAQATPELDAALAAVPADHGVSGVVATYDTDTGRLACGDLERCSRSVLPCSTYKIPHSLIALELGVIESAETTIPWDRREYPVPAWNKDHTLLTAMETSCVPCFAQIGIAIGPERSNEWLERLRYGNADASGDPERPYWLAGGNLRITPIQQLDFLYRLHQGELPISERSRQIAIDVIPSTRGEGYVLRGKTGGETDPQVGWYVGWLELSERTIYFATLLDGNPPKVDWRPARREVSVAALQKATGLSIE